MARSKMTSREKSEFIWGWAFILPTMAGLIILNIYPIFSTIYQSFFKTGDFGKGNIFVGFNNYAKVFADTEVWQALWNTIKYAIVEVPISIAISLVLAVFLNGKIKGKGTFRTIFFLPMVAAPAAIAMVWRWLYNSEFGLLNHILPGKTNWISKCSLTKNWTNCSGTVQLKRYIGTKSSALTIRISRCQNFQTKKFKPKSKR